MHKVNIIDMQLVQQPKPNAGGTTVLAYFNCAVGGFTMFACALVLTPKGCRRAWPPKCVGMPGNIGSKVRITDNALLKAMRDSARDAYLELRSATEGTA